MISEPASANVAAPISAPRQKLAFDVRYGPPLLITSIILVSHLCFGVLESPWHTIAAIATSIAVEIMLSQLTLGKFPHLASAYISGISVGILMRTPFFWPFVLCAAISVASKYVLRWEGRHLWNPSNFGICMMLFLAHQTVTTLSVQWDNRSYAMYLIWMVGAYTIYRLKRFHICATYVLSFLAFSAIRGVLTGHGFAIEAAPITGPMYQLFTFFMITDPKTTVKSRNGQIFVAFCVAAMEMVLRTMQIYQGAISDDNLRDLVTNVGLHAPYFALFTVGPIANAIDIWKHKQAQRAPQVALALSLTTLRLRRDCSKSWQFAAA